MNQATELPCDSILFEELISLMWEASDAILEGTGGSVNKIDGSPVTYGKSEILNP